VRSHKRPHSLFGFFFRKSSCIPNGSQLSENWLIVSFVAIAQWNLRSVQVAERPTLCHIPMPNATRSFHADTGIALENHFAHCLFLVKYSWQE
jgi:hypothetical protein